MAAPSTSPTGTRARIISAADRLFYEGGYEHTSFATIAIAVGISRGNFHHHFKTKDEILAAVIDRRCVNTAAMLDRWVKADSSPAAQLRCFIDLLAVNRTDIVRYGCPVGTLCSELAKAAHPMLDESSRLFELFRDWLRARFVDLDPSNDADDLTLHLLMVSQGIAVLANVHKDDRFIDREIAGLHRWLDEQLQTCVSTAPTPEGKGTP